jgi:inner membrane protein
VYDNFENNERGMIMDPLTHAIIGLGIGSFAQNTMDITNPLVIGCVIGSVIPDIDIVAKIKDDYLYLKHHRGMTHTIPGLGVLSAIIAGALKLFFAVSFGKLFFWTFLGALSHSLFDMLNSYGVKLLNPVGNSKQQKGILMLYDPIISILCILLMIIKNKTWIFYGSTLAVFGSYLIFKGISKESSRKKVLGYYKDNNVKDVRMLPALIAPYKWAFVTTTDDEYVVGQFNWIKNKVEETKRFKRQSEYDVELFKKSNVGKYFSNFTPIYHIKREKDGPYTVLKSTDLRYYLNNNFMHHATVVLDKDENIVKSFFHPYKIHKNIQVAE